MEQKDSPKLILNSDATEYFDVSPNEKYESYIHKLEDISENFHYIHEENVPHLTTEMISSYGPILMDYGNTISKQKTYGKSSVALASALTEYMSSANKNGELSGPTQLTDEEHASMQEMVANFDDVKLPEVTTLTSWIARSKIGNATANLVEKLPVKNVGAFINEDRLERKRVKAWINKNVEMDKHWSAKNVVMSIKGMDEITFRVHAEEIITELLAKNDSYTQRMCIDHSLMYMPEDMILDKNMYDIMMDAGLHRTVIKNIRAFEGIDLTPALFVDAVKRGAGTFEVIESLAKFDEDMSDVVKVMLLECDARTVAGALVAYGNDKFKFDVSAQMMEVVFDAGGCAELLVAGGFSKFDGIKIEDSFEVAELICKAGMADALKSMESVSHYTVDQVQRLVHLDSNVLNAVLSRRSEIDTLNDDAVFMEFLEKNEAYFAMDLYSFDASGFSADIQNFIFKAMFSRFASKKSFSVLHGWYGFNKLDADSIKMIMDTDTTWLLEDATTEHQVAHKLSLLGADESSIDIGNAEFWKALAERDAARKAMKERNQNRLRQIDTYRDYYNDGSVTLEPAAHDDVIEFDDMRERLENDGVVKWAPRIEGQMDDKTRTNPVLVSKAGKVVSIDEYDALKDFVKVMDKDISVLEAKKKQQSSIHRRIVSLRENITFIGEKEYNEAVSAIAGVWKQMLESRPTLKIAICSEISTDYHVKSDIYMLDNILKHFTDDELESYAGRITTDFRDIKNEQPEDVSIQLIDDWTISGSQMSSAAQKIIRDRPEFADSIQIQLIAASEERIKLGLEVEYYTYSEDHEHASKYLIPVRSYYLAHHAQEMVNDSARGVHVTGSHSAVDYGFTCMVSDLSARPKLADVARPYRQADYVASHIKRFTKYRDFAKSPQRRVS